jgi:hypothetical protein
LNQSQLCRRPRNLGLPKRRPRNRTTRRRKLQKQRVQTRMLMFQSPSLPRCSTGFPQKQTTPNSFQPIVESYLLQVRLTNSDDPVITRLLSVPSNFTFTKLHLVLQAAFGWAGCHAFSFTVSKLLEEGEVSKHSLLTLSPSSSQSTSAPILSPDAAKRY